MHLPNKDYFALWDRLLSPWRRMRFVWTLETLPLVELNILKQLHTSRNAISLQIPEIYTYKFPLPCLHSRTAYFPAWEFLWPFQKDQVFQMKHPKLHFQAPNKQIGLPKKFLYMECSERIVPEPQFGLIAVGAPQVSPKDLHTTPMARLTLRPKLFLRFLCVVELAWYPSGIFFEIQHRQPYETMPLHFA